MTQDCPKCASFIANKNTYDIINDFLKNTKQSKIVRYCKKCKKYKLIKIYKNKVKIESLSEKTNTDDSHIFENTEQINSDNKSKNKKCKCNNNSDVSSHNQNDNIENFEHLHKKENNVMNGNYMNNSYPYGNLGYNFPAHSYCIKKSKIPDTNKYFKNNSLNYNIQINKPIFSYDNYIMQKEIKNKNSCNCKYNSNSKPKKFVYNGNYEIANTQPNKLIVQANVNNSMYSQPNNNNNLTLGYNENITAVSGTIQSIEKTPAYTGVQAKTLPGQNLIAERNAEQTKANNANLNNPAYFNYGQYYY